MYFAVLGVQEGLEAGCARLGSADEAGAEADEAGFEGALETPLVHVIEGIKFQDGTGA